MGFADYQPYDPYAPGVYDQYHQHIKSILNARSKLVQIFNAYFLRACNVSNCISINPVIIRQQLELFYVELSNNAAVAPDTSLYLPLATALINQRQKQVLVQANGLVYETFTSLDNSTATIKLTNWLHNHEVYPLPILPQKLVQLPMEAPATDLQVNEDLLQEVSSQQFTLHEAFRKLNLQFKLTEPYTNSDI